MQQFVPYQYDKNIIWDSIETARFSLGLSKVDVATALQINSKQYAVTSNSRPNMQLSNAFLYTVAVGLSLDEAIRGTEESCFIRFLYQNGLSFDQLPADSLIRHTPYKGLIPTFIDFVSLSPDNRLSATIINAVAMPKADMMQFFYRVVGTEVEDFNDLFESMSVADPVDLFGENGLHRELMKYSSKQEFASHIGLTLGQLSRYLNYTENKRLQHSGKKIATVPLLDKTISICNVLHVGINEMMKPLFLFDDFIDSRLETAIDYSDKMYYFRSSFDYFSSVFQALPVLYPIVHRFCGATEETRKRIYELSQPRS